jgi:integrase
VTKSGKMRRVPVADRFLLLVQACAEDKGPDELRFTTRTGHQLHATAVKRSVAWSAAAPGRRIHDLRHTAALPVAGQGSGPRHGSGLARPRLDRHDQHLPAPPRRDR